MPEPPHDPEFRALRRAFLAASRLEAGARSRFLDQLEGLSESARRELEDLLHHSEAPHPALEIDRGSNDDEASDEADDQALVVTWVEPPRSLDRDRPEELG